MVSRIYSFMIQSIFKWTLFLLLTLPGYLKTSSAQTRYSIHSYIDQHADIAQNLMSESGTPASVILGVAIHESAFGNSKIARHLHNHFGVKGKNNSVKIQSAYKGYPSVKDSYQDFIKILKKRKQIKKLFQKDDHRAYESWIKAIASSGYASSKTWSRKVLQIIDKYELYQFDELKKEREFPMEPVLPLVHSTSIFKVLSPRFYTVQPNDSLEKIASMYNTSVESIAEKNLITDENLITGLGLIIG